MTSITLHAPRNTLRYAHKLLNQDDLPDALLELASVFENADDFEASALGSALGRAAEELHDARLNDDGGAQ